MDNSFLSQLNRYSIGIVAANKPLSTNVIEVVPIEQSPMISGEITDNVQTHDAEGSNSLGESFKTKIDSTLSITAKWMPFGDTNRVTSPDVRRGETVEIYRFSDTDEFYWATLKQSATLRRLETVVYAFSNNSKENVENDANSTYYFEISTHTKKITLHTSNNDGEPFKYDIQLNTKEGNLTIRDDVGNMIHLDSTVKRILLMNQDQSFTDIIGKTISMSADDMINLRTKNLNIRADNTTLIGSNVSVEAQVNVTGNINQQGELRNNGVKTGSIEADRAKLSIIQTSRPIGGL